MAQQPSYHGDVWSPLEALTREAPTLPGVASDIRKLQAGPSISADPFLSVPQAGTRHQNRWVSVRADRKIGAGGGGMMGVVSEVVSSGSLSPSSASSVRDGMILTILSSKCTCFFLTSESAASRVSPVRVSGPWGALGFLVPFRMLFMWMKREPVPSLKAPWKV